MILMRGMQIMGLIFGLANIVSVATTVSEGDENPTAPTLTVVPKPDAIREELSIEVLEEKLKEALQNFSILHLQMMGLQPGTPVGTLEGLLKQTLETSGEAAKKLSTLGRITYSKAVAYFLATKREDDPTTFSLRDLLPRLDHQIKAQATTGDPIALQYLINEGMWDGVEEATVVEESAAYLEALKVIAAEGDWASSTNEARLTKVKRLAEADSKVWDLVVDALMPNAIQALGLANMQPEERLSLLREVRAEENQKADDLYVQSILGDYNGASFRNLTTYFGLVDLPACFDSTVSLTQTVQPLGFDRPVEANVVMANRIKEIFVFALNGNKLAQDMILNPGASSQNLVQWWLNKRKAVSLRINQGSKELDETAKAAKVREIEENYLAMEQQLLKFWGFVFPLARII